MSDPNAPQDPAGTPQQPPAYGAPQPPAPPQPAAPPPGAPQYGQAYAPAPAQKSPILSILSLIGGIVGIVGAFFYFGGLFAIAAVVLGFIGRNKEPQAKGFWLTGIILGFVAIALEIIVIVVLAILIAAATSLRTY